MCEVRSFRFSEWCLGRRLAIASDEDSELEDSDSELEMRRKRRWGVEAVRSLLFFLADLDDDVAAASAVAKPDM